MTNPIKLASALPAEARNGLIEQLRSLIDSPQDHRLALIVFDVKRVEQDVDAAQKVPTIRIQRIETPLGLDRETAWEILQRAADARNKDEREGQQPLPFTTFRTEDED
jgi:hypothetical protein